MLLKRRGFLAGGTLATAYMMVPGFLKAMEKKQHVLQGNKVVVVLQLSGGNDGLNTVIPVRNDIYYKARPLLGIRREASLLLNDETGLHPALTAFKQLYDEGNLAVVNSVGYPEPERSHFRSMDIWHTAAESSEYLTTGWIGRYLDNYCTDCHQPVGGIEADDVLSLALKGEHVKGIALKDPRRLFNAANEAFFKDVLNNHEAVHEASTSSYLYKTLAETLSSAAYIFKESKQLPTIASYPATTLGHDLKTIASLIFSDINTRVYYVSLGSFDTHAGQAARQKKLFAEMNEAVAAFVADLKINHRFQDVLLFTFSEFGRRVQQNASNGTDHGAANNMLLVSGALQQKGLINPMDGLEDLMNGDIKFKVDFKQVYATVLHKWLGADDHRILGRAYEKLNFV